MTNERTAELAKSLVECAKDEDTPNQIRNIAGWLGSGLAAALANNKPAAQAFARDCTKIEEIATTGEMMTVLKKKQG